MYITLEEGEWDRSEFPDIRVTLDYDAKGNLIGIEILEPPEVLIRREEQGDVVQPG